MYLRAELSHAKVPESFEKYGYVLPPAPDDWKAQVPEFRERNDVYLIPGCKVQAEAPYLKYAAWKVFDAIGIGLAELPGNTCCMYPVPFRVMEESVRNGYKYSMRADVRSKGKDMVTLCSGCTNEFAASGIRAPNVCTYLSKYLDRIRKLPGVDLRVALEPGCSAECCLSDIIELVKATGATLVGNAYGCCGKDVPGIKDRLMAEREKECEGADVIVLCCPNCMIHYDRYEGGLPVMHLVELLAMAAGDTETLKFHRIKIGDSLLSDERMKRP